jgi:hypothetical protein
MNKVQEALKAAIDMIETLQNSGLVLTEIGNTVIYDCKAALAEIEKCEPVAWRMQTHPRGDYIIQKHKPDSARRDLWEALYTSPQPIEKCEPVAIKVTRSTDGRLLLTQPDGKYFDVNEAIGKTFYTSPISKEWVGLSDDERSDISREMVKSGKSVNWAASKIEAKLKQLNAPSYEQNNIPDEYEISVDTGDGIYHATEVVNFQQIGSKRIIQTIKL